MAIPTMITNIFQAIYGGGFLPAAAPLRHHGRRGDGRRDRRGRALRQSRLAEHDRLARPAAGALLPARAVRLAARCRARAERVGQSADRAGERRRRGLTGMAAVPFLPYMQSLQISTGTSSSRASASCSCSSPACLPWRSSMHNVFITANMIGGVGAVAPTFVGVWIGQKVAPPPRRRRSARFSSSACWRVACTWRPACCRIDRHAPPHPQITICGIPELPQHCRRASATCCRSSTPMSRARPRSTTSRGRPRADPLRRRGGGVSRLRGLHAGAYRQGARVRRAGARRAARAISWSIAMPASRARRRRPPS